MVTMWDLRQCFGWQMWMRWHKSEEAGRNCLRAWVGRSPVSKKQSVFHWSFCYWLNHTKKMALKRKSFVTPLTMILLLTKTYVFTFLSGRRSTVFCTAHSKRWCALVECRKSDRSSPQAVQLGRGQELLHSTSWAMKPNGAVIPKKHRTLWESIPVISTVTIPRMLT